MSAYTEIQNRATSLVWRLVIGGCDVVYYSGSQAPTAPTATDFGGSTVSGMSYTMSPGLNPPVQQALELDAITGLPRKQSALNVSIRSEGLRDVLYTSDPVRVLGRSGLAGSDWIADLLESVAHNDSGPASISVGSDPTGLTYPRLIHVNQETMWATSASGAGTQASPWKINGIVRGVLNSPIQAHPASYSNGDVSVVQPHKTTWDGAPVSLQCANRRTGDGTLSDFVEVVAGYLDGDPEIDDGQEVRLSIQPLPNLLYTKLGGGLSPTYFVDGFHLFGAYAGNLWVRQTLPDRMISGVIGGAAAGGVGYLAVDEPSFDLHAAVFDPDVAGRAADDGRRGPILYSVQLDRLLWPDDYTEVGGEFHIDLISPDAQGDNVPTQGQVVDYWWQSAETYVDRIVDLRADGDDYTLRRWPNYLETAWNATTGFAPGSTQGDDGLWYDLRLDVDAGTITTKPNVEVEHGSSPIHGGRFALTAKHLRDISNSSDPTPPIARTEHLWFPLFPAGDDREKPTGTTSIDVAVTPTCYYHPNERHILVTSAAPLTPPFDIAIEHQTRDGEDETVFGTVVASTAVSDGGSTIGYRWDFDYPLQQGDARQTVGGIGNFGTLPRVDPVIRIQGDDIIDVLLRLLMSGTGQGINSATYDVYPLGLNLRESQVDVASFTAFPRGVATWEKDIRVGEDLKDLLEGILHLLGASIIQRLDTDSLTQKIALVSAGQPNALLSVGTIQQSDVHGTPTSDAIHDKINRYVYTVKLPAYTEPLTIPLDYTSARAARRSGVVEREIDLTGLQLGTSDVATIQQVLRLSASRSINYAAYSRRRFSLDVSVAKSHTLNLGDVVLVTHPTLIPANPGAGRGVSSAPCRIVKIRRNYSGTPIARVDLEYTAANTTGWAPALKVASIVNTTTVTVEANEYTATVHPVLGTAQTDLGLGADSLYFEDGDGVRIFTPGDWSNGTTTTIATVTYATNTVEFDDVHGAAVGDIIEPGVYSVATARMGGFAFLSPLTGASAKAYS